MPTNVVAFDPPSKFLRAGLWIAQILLFGGFMSAAWLKLSAPVSKLAAMFPWMGQMPEAFVRSTGCIDLVGGMGILLPALTRIKPGLTVPAALGCALLMAAAIVFHFSRGEGAATPFNFVLLALSLFVLWGRYRKAPVLPRLSLATDRTVG